MRCAPPPPPESWAPALEAELTQGPPAARPLVAVSGGPDSLALLLLLAAARPGRFAAATFDHGLRPAGADEAAMVAALCAERGIAHATLHPPQPLDPAPRATERGVVVGTVGGDVQSLVLPPLDRASLMARARAARYDALIAHARATGCDLLLTAHHRDDQAETFLMRASRGSGVDGLAGVRRATRWRDFPVFRPVLRWPRRSLEQVVAGAKLHAVSDPTNADPAYDRTRFRRLIAEHNELRVDGLIRSAATLADASEALRWITDQLVPQRISDDGDALLVDARDLPRELRRRLLERAVRQRGGQPPRGPALDAALDELGEGQQCSLGALLIQRLAHERWRVVPAPPRRSL